MNLEKRALLAPRAVCGCKSQLRRKLHSASRVGQRDAKATLVGESVWHVIVTYVAVTGTWRNGTLRREIALVNDVHAFQQAGQGNERGDTLF